MWLIFCFRCETTVTQFENSAALAGTQCENKRLFFQWRGSLVGSTLLSYSSFPSLKHTQHTHTHTSCQSLSFILNTLNKSYIFVVMLTSKRETRKENIFFSKVKLRWYHPRHRLWSRCNMSVWDIYWVSIYLKSASRCCVWYTALATGRTTKDQRSQRSADTHNVCIFETINHWFTAEIAQ